MVLRNLINLVLASYGVAILLVGITVLLARLQARQHEKTSMRIPNEDVDAGVGAKPRRVSAETAALRKRVLLIDDSHDVQVLVQHALVKHGAGKYDLIWADSLKEGFRELTSGEVDVVLLDLGLPEASGSISFACVRGCAPEVPVLVMTGDDSKETGELIVAAGVDDYLVKQQLSGARLVQAIEAVLRKSERPAQVNISKIRQR